MHKYNVRTPLKDIHCLMGKAAYSADPSSPMYAPRWLKLAADLRVGGAEPNGCVGLRLPGYALG